MEGNIQPATIEAHQLPNFDVEMAQRKLALQKVTHMNWNLLVTHYDCRFEAKIHKLNLSGKDCTRGVYDFNSLKQGIPKLALLKLDPEKSKSKKYRSMYRLVQDGIKMNIYTHKRLDLYGPPCYLTIVPPNRITIRQFKNFLILINGAIPELQIAVAEYTIDQFCRGPEDAKMLFAIERRNLQVPNVRRMLTKKSDTNETVYYGKKKFKIYIRGKTPRSRNVNRVRIEYTPTRKCLVHKHGIDILTDFIRGPKFGEVFNDIFDFHRFEGSRKLPLDYEGYPTKDANGFSGAFQLEHIAHRPDKKLNLADYVRKVDELTPLYKALREAMKEFDQRWQTG